MASKSLAVMSETPAASPQFEFDFASVNFSVTGRDVSSGEPKAFQFQESANLNFSDEASLNKTIAEKPYLLQIIPQLVKLAVDSYDPANENAKKLKDDIAALLGL
ncbi:hypothetical protein [Dyadobacter fermentans]|uniref:Uncharacterized protein n=1 Tax=Dyadobacter fermentans (strain ATCC 700827 / DSM 18053 / CIP 107007 / KCTC 52180 / NS114) TaxID=471854 RepID=C6VVI3_DYAFD|nr:hypothetical protein [Dyadobacter fermentans]ACT96713.1 hypothetical protein Dfer_5522 [Dyadobacter fermentans DSM 18053]